MNEITKILNSDEHVLWEGKPQRLPWVMSSLPAAAMGAVWTAATGLFGFMFITGGAPWFFAVIFVPSILIGIAMLGAPLWALIGHHYVYYVLTDKRAIQQQGIIGRDFSYADYDKVSSSSVSVGIIDKVFGTDSGTILMVTGTAIYSGSSSSGGASVTTLGVTFRHISGPYKTFELFKKVSLDVRADISYPNALRPEANEGYGTRYQDQSPRA